MRKKAGMLAEFWKSPSSNLILPLFYYKSIILFFILFCIVLLPIFNAGEFKSNIHFPQNRTYVFEDHFKSYDGHHYLFIAENGYPFPNSLTNAFYPFWPFLIRVFHYFTFDYLAAALILSAVFSIAGIALFHYFVSKHHGLKIANISTLFLLAFPAALFFNFPYSESLFFLLSILFFFFLFEKKYFLLSITAFLMPLTRPVGIFCAIPLFYSVYKSKEKKNWLLLLAPALGFVLYLLIMYAFTGNLFEGFAVQKFYPHHASVLNAFDILGFIKSLLGASNFHSYLGSMMDRIFFLVFVLFLPLIWKINKQYFWYSLAIGYIPAATASFASFTRYFIAIFPVFIAAACFFEKKDKKYLWVALVLFLIQIFFLIKFINNCWVG